jgi:uncharacterized cupin superfamily protein
LAGTDVQTRGRCSAGVCSSSAFRDGKACCLSKRGAHQVAQCLATVLECEVQVTFRGHTLVARAGETINVPANAPHAFTNDADAPSRLLCMCAPAGQEQFFNLVGQPVAVPGP